VLTEIGPAEIEVPRNVAATFTPQIVQKAAAPASPRCCSRSPGSSSSVAMP